MTSAKCASDGRYLKIFLLYLVLLCIPRLAVSVAQIAINFKVSFLSLLGLLSNFNKFIF